MFVRAALAVCNARFVCICAVSGCACYAVCVLASAALYLYAPTMLFYQLAQHMCDCYLHACSSARADEAVCAHVIVAA